MMKDFDPDALAPAAQVLYGRMLENLRGRERAAFLSLLKLAFYQGATEGANEMHRQAKEVFKSDAIVPKEGQIIGSTD